VSFELVDAKDCKLDSSLRSMAHELLPLATSFARVSHFVSSHLPGYEYGSVMQGFCEGLDVLLHEYMVFITGLEQKYRRDPDHDFLIRRLQVQVRPSLHAMSVLERATQTVSDQKGGGLINALRNLKSRTYEGDAVADNVLQILLDRASVPYMNMLNQWLECGVLLDPYQEFLVESHDGDILGRTVQACRRPRLAELFLVKNYRRKSACCRKVLEYRTRLRQCRK